MRIVRNECLKILDLRRILVIVLFTVLYYMLFMHLQKYPYIYSWGSAFAQRYVPELVEDVGPSLSGEEWHRMEEKRQELLAQTAEILSSNAALADAGIDGYESWQDAYNQLFSPASLSAEEQILRSEVMAVYEQEGDAQKCLTLLQYIDKLEYLHEAGCYFAVPASDAESVAQESWGHATPLFQKAMADFCQRDLSMLPHLMLMLLWSDMKAMTVLLVICSLILLVPYQIHVRLCEVTPLYAATRTGRGFFGRQLAAELISCGLVSALQLLVYVGIFISKGLTVYWKCPAWPDGTTAFWLDITYGAYMAIYLSMVWLFVMGSVAAAYCVGRCSANYIAGIAASIPVGGVVCLLGRRLMNSPLAFTEQVRVPFWEPGALLLWLTAAGVLIAVLLKRDRKRDL